MMKGRNLLGLLRGNIQILWLMVPKRSACDQTAAAQTPEAEAAGGSA